MRRTWAEEYIHPVPNDSTPLTERVAAVFEDAFSLFQHAVGHPIRPQALTVRMSFESIDIQTFGGEFLPPRALLCSMDFSYSEDVDE